MQRNNIIILTQMCDYRQEAWGSLTQLCKNHAEFKYRAINTLKFPFEYKGWLFAKVPYNSTTKTN